MYSVFQAHDKYRDLQCYIREVPHLEEPIHVEELHRNPNVYIVRNLFPDSELNRVRDGAQEQVRLVSYSTGSGGGGWVYPELVPLIYWIN